MELRDYLHFERMTLKDLAAKLEMTQGHLCRIVNRKVNITRRLAKDIERETQGKVTASELLKENNMNSVEENALSA